MSTNLALVDPAVAPSRAPRPDHVRPERKRPELVEVTPTKAQRRARPRVAYAIVAIAALGLLLLAQLGISMGLSQGAYTLSSLKTEQTGLTRTQASLSEGLKVLESPQNLARNAQALGMIANSTPVYLDPKTGTVYGTPTPATPEEATGNTANQVPNSLLGDVPLAAKQGDTATSKENSTTAPAAGAVAATAPADTGKAGASSASDQGSTKSSVESDANQLQAPTTR
ncbi:MULTISPECIES: hypothetical protein [unclassified Curtobacterium]|uniref:hypothetical protein n=1 Tax=unclassified Curtobacterium TaxID=257496 RepID=UPI000D9FD47A|nr:MULTISPECIES: hypothetical protein [unclassified Curtobacterium]PYY35783.1 hypothetical protein DEI89_05770 [Curtobacterium sp. MCBD17_030]PZE36567.1 hypothetical protein DEJ31_09405 [Curtobacterium sp. MCPF17_031]PZF10640.1 hypothetical protein DEJ25_12465 [Curtobacterium sp. MCPF17_011]